MLDSLRNFATTWVGKILGAFLLVGLAGFGISGVITGIGTNTVAKVGSEDISSRDFQRAYNSQINALAAQTGSVPTPEQAIALGVPSSTLNQLATEAALNELGRDFGLGASDEKLGELLREDPSFASALGNFDSQNFRRVLQQAGYTENEYLEMQLDAARRQQILLGVFQDAPVPQAALELINRYRDDTRTIDYFILTREGLLPPAEPTEEEMAAYLTENQGEYRTVPTRTVKVMALSPEIIAEDLAVSDAEIAAEYERTQANYVTIETRDVQQVILPSDTLVRWFEMGIESGKSFDAVVEEAQLPVTDLGTLTRDQITDARLAEAAFSLEEGEYTLIPAAQGMRAVTVSNIVPGGQQSLDEVRDQVAERVQLRQARESYIDILDQIEELRAAFRPIEEIAAEFDLPLQEVDVTSSGAALADVEGIPEEARAEVASAIFAADMGELAPTVTLGANRNVWFDLLEISPARDQTLDEVRDEVRQDMLDDRMQAALEEQVDQIQAQLDEGQAFADVAVGLNQFPQLSQPFNRQGSGSPVISPDVAAAAFGGGAGYHGAAQNADGDYVVFEVTDVTPAEEPSADVRQLVENSIVDSTYSEFVSALRNDAGMRINEGVLTQLLGADGTQ